jgi:hypothetical protein
MNTRWRTQRARTANGRRRSRPVLVAAYVLGLAAFPGAVSLGQSSAPTLSGEATLEGGEQGRFQPLSWQLLAGFVYEVPGPFEEASAQAIARSRASVPERVRALDGKEVALRGYVIPLDTRRGRVTSFVLAASNQIGCCFGDSLAMNEWVAVDVPKGQEFESEPFEIATVLGKLHVGEEVEDGYVMGLYRMVPQKIRKG